LLPLVIVTVGIETCLVFVNVKAYKRGIGEGNLIIKRLARGLIFLHKLLLRSDFPPSREFEEVAAFLVQISAVSFILFAILDLRLSSVLLEALFVSLAVSLAWDLSVLKNKRIP
jgi:hypothetical protein